MKAVVTGGAGFIGSALIRHLISQGADSVTAFDNLNSGHRKNLEGLSSQVTLAEGDIRDYDAVAAAFSGADLVFHLAAIPSVPRSIKDPIPSHDVNINGSFNVFRAAKDTGVRRVVYAASSSAYGDTEVLPKVESMQANPKSPYAAQKLMGEHYASVFSSCFQLETVSLRFFNVFGPRQDPNSAYSGVLPTIALSEAEQKVWDSLRAADETTIDEVIRHSGLPSSTVSVALLGLEMKRVVKQLPGKLFVRNR